jgi:hypothetical protein
MDDRILILWISKFLQQGEHAVEVELCLRKFGNMFEAIIYIRVEVGMYERRLLQQQITKAWRQCIEEDYCIQRINSERSLQASFWSRLNLLLSKNRRMFIEPCLVIKTNTGTLRVYPDLVICNTKAVIGIVELKYQPRAKPNHIKDLATLSNVAQHRKHISISNQRFRGQFFDETVYSLSKHILFVWAGIHASTNSTNKSSVPLYSTGYDHLKGCFMELHAETTVNSLPKIYTR